MRKIVKQEVLLITVVQGQFEWDSEKNEVNIKKHGFSFEDFCLAH